MDAGKQSAEFSNKFFRLCIRGFVFAKEPSNVVRIRIKNAVRDLKQSLSQSIILPPIDIGPKFAF